MKFSQTFGILLAGFVGGAGLIALLAAYGLGPRPTAGVSPAATLPPVLASSETETAYPTQTLAPAAVTVAAYREPAPVQRIVIDDPFRLPEPEYTQARVADDYEPVRIVRERDRPVSNSRETDQEVDSLRGDWPRSESVATVAEVERVDLPAGVQIVGVLDAPLSSRTARLGDTVRVRTTEDVRYDGEVIVPAGSRIRGVVKEAKEAGRVKGNGQIRVAFTELELPDGYTTSISGLWEEKAEGKRKRDAGIIGGSAAGGALLGQVLGEDSESTLGGAVLGGAIGTGVVLANRGRDLELEAGHRMVFETLSTTRLPSRG